MIPRFRPRLALVLALAVVGCASAATHVPLPSEPAPPRIVLLAYLDALVAGDCTTARSLATPELAAMPSGIWCDQPRVVGYTAPAASDEPGGDPLAQLVYAVEIDVRGGDPSLPDGRRIWFFVLEPRGGVWRVTDTGSGP